MAEVKIIFDNGECIKRTEEGTKEEIEGFYLNRKFILDEKVVKCTEIHIVK